jgi:hypothetical protein
LAAPQFKRTCGAKLEIVEVGVDVEDSHGWQNDPGNRSPAIGHPASRALA